MIPAANVTQWAAGAPWPTRRQIEQDLVLSRLIVEIARDETLGPELAFRGGTCLHKLHLGQALRYSEDLDCVRTSNSGIRLYLNALRTITERVGLAEKTTTRSGQMVHFACEAPAEDGGAIAVKIESTSPRPNRSCRRSRSPSPYGRAGSTGRSPCLPSRWKS